jgi:uncharacterized membrane protein YeiH
MRAYSAGVDNIVSFIPNIASETPVWLSLIATATGALEGALLGRQRSPTVDIAGLTILALSLGFGGGMIRDVLIGNTPPEALREWYYIATVGLAILIIVLIGRQIARFTYSLFILDALTMGLFAAVGAQYAITFQLPALTAIFVGSFAAVGGGLAASLLLREVPSIMRPGPPYAVAAVAGTVVYVLLDGFHGGLASIACVFVVFAIRVIAERMGLRTSPIRPIDG